MNPFRIILLATAFLLLFCVSALHAAPVAQTPQSRKSASAPPKVGAAQPPKQQPGMNKPGDFTAKKGLLPYIKITRPAGGENWRAGDQQKLIQWETYGNLGGFKITLQSGTGTEYVLGEYSFSNPLSFVDIPEQVVPGNNYRVVVTSNAIPSIKGTSNLFTVKPKPVIKLVSPTGGEVWHKGSNYNIKWTYSGDPDPIVSIWLLVINSNLDMGRKLAEVTISDSGSGSYNWTIPYDVQRRSDWVVYVVSGHYLMNSLYRGRSNAFTIDE